MLPISFTFLLKFMGNTITSKNNSNCNPSMKMRQDDHKCKACLGYTSKLCFIMLCHNKKMQKENPIRCFLFKEITSHI